jgi:hypothetical protein
MYKFKILCYNYGEFRNKNEVTAKLFASDEEKALEQAERMVKRELYKCISVEEYPQTEIKCDDKILNQVLDV